MHIRVHTPMTKGAGDVLAVTPLIAPEGGTVGAGRETEENPEKATGPGHPDLDQDTANVLEVEAVIDPAGEDLVANPMTEEKAKLRGRLETGRGEKQRTLVQK
ncbi:uncharacterized protein PAF06_006995 [Gastrophryne carolinensis]